MRYWSGRPAGVLIAFIAILWFAVACSQPGHSQPTGSLMGAYASLVEALGDETLPVEKRYVASNMLQQASDKDLVELLVSHVADTRVFDPQYDVCSTHREPPRLQTVGMQCQDILRFLIAGGDALDYKVTDWQGWWDLNKDMSIEEIIASVRAGGKPSKGDAQR